MKLYDIVLGKKPDLSNLRIFGTKVKVLKPKPYRKGKMDAKTWNGIHVVYAPGDAYRAYIPELKRAFVTKDITFFEKLYGNSTTSPIDIENEPSVKEESDNISEDEASIENAKNSSESSEYEFHEANDDVHNNNGKKIDAMGKR